MGKSHHSPNEIRVFPQKRYVERRHWLDSIKIASGCIDCGLKGPAEALTFDHVRGEKLFNVGQSWNQGKQKLVDEIAKCEIRCANCHAIKTKLQNSTPEFVPFPKIARLFREMVVSEKIDGSNATVWVDGEGDVWAGSRNRWITPEDDNYGFASWVKAREKEFAELGPTVLRGEWWGKGIQRGYGLEEKRFSVFNPNVEIPEFCFRVPILYQGPFDTEVVNKEVRRLRLYGSYAAPGFMNPEGVVTFHTASGQLFKTTCENDETPKSAVVALPVAA